MNDTFLYTFQSTEIVQQLIADHQEAREQLQEHVYGIEDFVKRLPEARKVDLANAFPTALKDLEAVHKQLRTDECVILVAGTWEAMCKLPFCSFTF